MKWLGKIATEPEYIDWLFEIERSGGEFAWIRKTKSFPKNATGKERTVDEINTSVLNSFRVQTAIKEEAIKRNIDEKLLKTEAEEILNNMAHSFNMTAVRTIGYGVVKVIKQVFDKIFVNINALKKIRELLPNDAVVFMPTHKTYVDFMLVSLLCFDQDVTLPAIAAGSDFQNSKIMGEALRRCGAFYIRRAFGDDQLYWAVFAEYIQTHLIHADRPVEFFIEGTRSRTSKSLYPKYGLLQNLLEPFLKSNVFDLQIVPITINYDKILEESLYAYELLGFPKPKESTSSLFKARQILNKSFGNVYMTFGDPISARKYFHGTIDRSILSFQPDAYMVVPNDQKEVIRKFGHKIVRLHNAHNVITLWPLVCLAILDAIDTSKHSSILEDVSINYANLLKNTQLLLELCTCLHIQIQILRSLEEDLRYYLELHSDLFEPFNINDANFELKFIEFPIDNNGIVHKRLLQKSVTSIILSNYANQALDVFADLSFVSIILQIQPNSTNEKMLSEFCELQNLFEKEFIRVPENREFDFIESLNRLKQGGLISQQDIGFSVNASSKIKELSNLIMPFLHCYSLIFDIFIRLESSITSKNVIAACQQRMAQIFEKNSQNSNLRLAFLSSDLIKNAYSLLLARKIIILKGSHDMRINTNELLELDEKLKKYLSNYEAADAVVLHARL